jgi:hypothetical protein
LSYVHRGTLWIGPPISIDTQLISWITGLSIVGEDLKMIFTNNSWEKALSECMKENFKNFRGKSGLDVAIISDDVVRFAMQVLACKLVRKCWKDEVSSAIIVVVEKCIEGI